MQINKYLIIWPSRKWNNPNVKIVGTLKGTMPSNAIALKLNIELPNAIFQKPQLSATIKIKEEDVSKPVINAQVIDNIKQVLSQNMGINMTIQVVESKEQ